MSHATGTYLGGIRSVECLRQRSYVDPDTGCWHWRRGFSAGFPRMWLVIDGKRMACRGRRGALLLAGRLKNGQFAIARVCCKSDDCVNPDHSKSATRKEHGKWISRTKRYADSLARKAASFKARLARKNRKLDIEKAREIRASTETNKVLAKRYGICETVASAIKRGELWKEPEWTPQDWRQQA